MGCSNCSTKDGKPGGCRSNGGCSTGGCNRLNTYDWLSTRDIQDPTGTDVVEISFKNGARKNFYQNAVHTKSSSGDMVVVETGSGHDIGQITLSGELVRLQMRKKKVPEDAVLNKVVRRANERDLERMTEARSYERDTLIRARVIARTLGLEMKLGDVEYQADRRKATFYYTADGRVDFRELIRHYAKEFRVKIEMRQIGARQESARIGGIGSCGRELCCSTWLSEFKSVSTGAARYQNLAINQAKLSGQCGRLKCCLNYELDTYLDALSHFPKHVDTLKTEVGIASLIKTDIFKGLLYYVYRSVEGRPGGSGKFYPLSIERVKFIKELNEKGEFPSDLQDYQAVLALEAEAKAMDFDEDLTGFIELPPEERRKRKRRRKRNKNKNEGAKTGANKSNPGTPKKGGTANKDNKEAGAKKTNARNTSKPKPKNTGQDKSKQSTNPEDQKKNSRSRRRPNRRRGRGKRDDQKSGGGNSNDGKKDNT